MRNTLPVPILFTIPNFVTAGSGRAMLNIIERLDRSSFSPAVCVLKRGGNLDKEVERMGIPLIEAPFTVPVLPRHYLLIRAYKAAQNFRAYRFVLWHSFHYASDYTEPIIARMAGAKAWIFTKKNMGWGSRSWLLRSLLATRIAVQNTDMMKQFFSSWYFRSKARLIPRGVVTTRFHPRVPPRLGLRERLKISKDAIVVACVAHMVPVKGHPTLLQAVARVQSLHLLLAGKPLDEAYVGSLKSLIRELNIMTRVHFLGEVDDVPAMLAETDIFVLPTWAKWRMEGCPVALLEAMACGKACIATDVPGSRDVVVNGETGFLVPPEDPDALAEALISLTSSKHLRDRLGYSARKRVEMYYSIEREVQAHVALYEEILGDL